MNRLRSAILTLALLFLPAIAAAAPALGGPVSPDGTPVMIDVPARLRIKNVGGSDGAGLCVFSSINVSAFMQLETDLYDLQKKMRSEKGGGWPEKVDSIIGKWAPHCDYAQYQGTDPSVIKAALRSGRVPGVTYNGHDPHYQTTIAHMVNCVHYDDRWVAILDNNYIGPSDLVWMTPAEFQERWCGRGSGWAVFLLKDPPNPLPSLGPVEHVVEQRQEKSPALEYRWVTYDGRTWPGHSTDEVWLYIGPEENAASTVGCYYRSSRQFYFYDHAAKKWLRPGPPPFEVPAAGRLGHVGSVVDYGVPLNLFPRRAEGEDLWTRKGKAADAATILGMMPPKKDQPLADAQAPAATIPLCLALVSLWGMYLKYGRSLRLTASRV